MQLDSVWIFFLFYLMTHSSLVQIPVPILIHPCWIPRCIQLDRPTRSCGTQIFELHELIMIGGMSEDLLRWMLLLRMMLRVSGVSSEGRRNQRCGSGRRWAMMKMMRSWRKHQSARCWITGNHRHGH